MLTAGCSEFKNPGKFTPTQDYKEDCLQLRQWWRCGELAPRHFGDRLRITEAQHRRSFSSFMGLSWPRANEFSHYAGAKSRRVGGMIAARPRPAQHSFKGTRCLTASVAATARTKAMQAACDRCHRRKSRCNKAKPKCGFCAKANVECCYSERSRDPSVRREYVEGIEKRLRQEEAKTHALNSELARLRSLAASGDSEAFDTPRDVIQVSGAVS